MSTFGRIRVVVLTLWVCSLLLAPAAPAAQAAVTVIRVPQDVSSLQTAISQVSDGGVIELSAGTYVPPSNEGFKLGDLGKGFTLRAAPGASVTIDGQGSKELFRFQNKNLGNGRTIIFERLTLANGRSNAAGTAGGITMYYAKATFIDVTFQNNAGQSTSVVGGALYVTEGSTAFFIDCTWNNNTAKFGGAGIGIRSDAKVYIHRGRFTGNQANPAGHLDGSSGGAISVGNATLRISNTRFEGNQAAGFGGALYVIGNWQGDVNIPRADVIVANSTFINNSVAKNPSSSQSLTTEGGAINVEDQSRVRIYHSRFINNQAMIGGGVNGYRSKIEVYDSVFLGNRAIGSEYTAAFGGAITTNSLDGPGDGTNNRPTASLIIQDTYIQGRYGSTTTVAQTAGGIHSSGDFTRFDGDSTVPDMGGVSGNRATANVDRVIINDTDVDAAGSNSGVGGAVLATISDFEMHDSLIINADAVDNSSSAGGVAVLYHSDADIINLTAAHNNAGCYGGGVFLQGATLRMSGSRFFANGITNTASCNSWDGLSYGAAFFAAPDTTRNINANGLVENNIFSKNNGLPVFDDDRNSGAYNAVQYNANQFFSNALNSSAVYKDSLQGGALTASSLNNLVVNRSGSSTDKSPANNNADLGSAPTLAVLRAAPATVLPVTAAGDPESVTTSYLGYASSGASATLDGIGLASDTGVQSGKGAGSYVLQVGGVSSSATVIQGVAPDAFFKATIRTSDTLLEWNLTAGTFLDSAIDQGVNTGSAASGSLTVGNTLGRTYTFYAITKEGGVIKRSDGQLPVLAGPGGMLVLAAKDRPLNKGYLSIWNEGSSVINWTASDNVAFITINTPNGVMETSGVVAFTINTAGLSIGDHLATITVDGGEAGLLQIPVTVRVVGTLKDLFLPLNNG